MPVHCLFGLFALAVSSNAAEIPTDLLVAVSLFLGWAFCLLNVAILYRAYAPDLKSLLRVMGRATLVVAPVAALTSGLLAATVDLVGAGVGTFLFAYLSEMFEPRGIRR